jgi:hypothetical protein
MPRPKKKRRAAAMIAATHTITVRGMKSPSIKASVSSESQPPPPCELTMVTVFLEVT